jgi:hypothetical protein
MEADRLKTTILENAAEVARLHTRIHETFKRRGENPQKHREWELACEKFHKRYNELAFPGGYDGALERILSGDAEAMEAAICFLECRPYFFRSGYMFKDILRKCKKAPLSSEQRSRFTIVLGEVEEWRRRKTSYKAAT